MNLEVYIELFENSFLGNTERFYRFKSAEILGQGPVPDYLKYVEQRLAKEQELGQSCLHESTMEKLMEMCQKVLIKEHIQVLQVLSYMFFLQDF